MKVKLTVVVGAILLLGVVGVWFTANRSTRLTAREAVKTQVKENELSGLATATSVPTQTDFTARFEIYTLGTKRTFNAVMYHNQSDDVYIESPDPNIVNIKAGGITWKDFFDTLPFSLDETCLTTGTRETFCTNGSGTLKFYLNGFDTPNVLTLPIRAGDSSRVSYE